MDAAAVFPRAASDYSGDMIYIPVALIAVAALFLWRAWKRRQMRTFLLGTILSDQEREIVARTVPLTRKLPDALRLPFEGKMALFLHQVDFIGCNGLEVTQEMELSIAAQACLLVAGNDMWYETLTTVMIYPSAFKSVQINFDGVVATEEEIVRTGESWTRGPVILSWRDAVRGADDDDDGHNVVFHEFAHQIDDSSGQTDGAPLLAKGQDFAEWSRVFVDAFDRHTANTERRHRTVLDPYGASAPEELFAVAVEVFFERPKDLRREEPEIYGQLRTLFGVDPARWG